MRSLRRPDLEQQLAHLGDRRPHGWHAGLLAMHRHGHAWADTTPFPDAANSGWEDDLDHPRSADELVTAWTTTWGIVERAFDAWTPDMLDESVARGQGDASHFTRRSLLLRLITHQAYHVGEIVVIQGIHGRRQIDLWPPDYHTVEAAAARDAR